uniref:Post-SET domain-containing protein n=2 Tax=Macrostomum lignano TaxID=282301 RepID=A0A1I8G4T3_9PLAT
CSTSAAPLPVRSQLKTKVHRHLQPASGISESRGRLMTGQPAASAANAAAAAAAAAAVTTTMVEQLRIRIHPASTEHHQYQQQHQRHPLQLPGQNHQSRWSAPSLCTDPIGLSLWGSPDVAEPDKTEAAAPGADAASPVEARLQRRDRQPATHRATVPMSREQLQKICACGSPACVGAWDDGDRDDDEEAAAEQGGGDSGTFNAESVDFKAKDEAADRACALLPRVPRC